MKSPSMTDLLPRISRRLSVRTGAYCGAKFLSRKVYISLLNLQYFVRKAITSPKVLREHFSRFLVSLLLGPTTICFVYQQFVMLSQRFYVYLRNAPHLQKYLIYKIALGTGSGPDFHFPLYASCPGVHIT